jgi:hypothetical protein
VDIRHNQRMRRSRHANRVRLAIGIASLLLAMTVGGCVPTHAGQREGKSTGRLVVPGAPGHSATVTLPSRFAHRPVTLGSMMICVRGTSSAAHVIRVTPHDGNGHVRVTAFGVRRDPELRGSYTIASSLKSLRELGIDDTTVRTHCSAGGEKALSELAVTERGTGQGDGVDDGVTITYRLDGHVDTTTFPYGIRICSPHSPGEPACTG